MSKRTTLLILGSLMAASAAARAEERPKDRFDVAAEVVGRDESIALAKQAPNLESSPEVIDRQSSTSFVRGVVQTAADGSVLVGVEVDATVAADPSRIAAVLIDRIEDARDNTILRSTLFVRYRVRDVEVAETLQRRQGQKVRLELRRTFTLRPVVVAAYAL